MKHVMMITKNHLLYEINRTLQCYSSLKKWVNDLFLSLWALNFFSNGDKSIKTFSTMNENSYLLKYYK